MNFKVGDKVILNCSAMGFDWYDQKVRTIIQFIGKYQIKLHPEFNDGDSIIDPGYLMLTALRGNKFEKFYDEQVEEG